MNKVNQAAIIGLLLVIAIPAAGSIIETLTEPCPVVHTTIEGPICLDEYNAEQTERQRETQEWLDSGKPWRMPTQENPYK